MKLSSTSPVKEAMTESSIFIREAGPPDAGVIASIWTRAIREGASPAYADYPGAIETWAADKDASCVQRRLEDPLVYNIVAEDNGEVLGFGAITQDGEILSCYVLPEASGRGVGAAICRALEDWAGKRGLQRIHLSSSLNARRFYERQGYHASGEMELYNEKVPCLPMEKKLE